VLARHRARATTFLDQNDTFISPMMR
jgi:hypothetical protein